MGRSERRTGANVCVACGSCWDLYKRRGREERGSSRDELHVWHDMEVALLGGQMAGCSELRDPVSYYIVTKFHYRSICSNQLVPFCFLLLQV